MISSGNAQFHRKWRMPSSKTLRPSSQYRADPKSSRQKARSLHSTVSSRFTLKEMMRKRIKTRTRTTGFQPWKWAKTCPEPKSWQLKGSQSMLHDSPKRVWLSGLKSWASDVRLPTPQQYPLFKTGGMLRKETEMEYRAISN